MRSFLICFRGLAPFVVEATDRSAARTYALQLRGFTPNGPAPRGLTIATV